MCALLLSLPVASKAAKSKVPPGSFLTRPVSSASELAKLVREDKVTALRFSKHFGMDPAALALYFEDHLSVSTLKSSQRFTVYFIAENGRIVTRKKTLKAGTKIFVGHDGQPVMDIACGNPFAKSLPKVPKVAKAVPPVFPKPLVLPPEPVVPAVTEPPPPTVENPSVAEVLSEPLEPVEVEVLATPALEFPPAAIWLIPSLIGVGALAGGGNGPIPEPTSLFVLGTGVVGLLFKFGRSVKSSRGRSKMKSTCSYIAILLIIGGLLAAAPAHAVPWSAGQSSGITYVDSVLAPTPGPDIWTYTWELTNQSPVTINSEDITVLVWSLQPFNIPAPTGTTAPAGWEWDDSSKMWQMYEIADPPEKYYQPPALGPGETIVFTYTCDINGSKTNPFGDGYPGDPVNDIGFITHIGAVEPEPMNPGDPVVQWIPSTTEAYGDTWYDIPVVPEPSSLFALGTAGATLLGGIIRRRRDS